MMDEPLIRLAIRVTARTSLLFFLGAFAGATLAAWWPGQFTAWLSRRRRALLVALAASHTVHLAAAAALGAVTHGKSWKDAGISSFVGGGLAYVLIYAMVLWPSRIWLNSIAMYWVWAIFFISYTSRTAFEFLSYLPLVLLLVAALALRVLARPARGSV